MYDNDTWMKGKMTQFYTELETDTDWMAEEEMWREHYEQI